MMYNDLRASPWQCIKPVYPNRMVLLILGKVTYTLNSNYSFATPAHIGIESMN